MHRGLHEEMPGSFDDYNELAQRALRVLREQPIPKAVYLERKGVDKE